ncbi:MAG: TVP38/TMEM64 family protein [Chlamydiales bacterium]|nr:TVP38/TMEM64 family protein [Chlamydiales bacterium]
MNKFLKRWLPILIILSGMLIAYFFGAAKLLSFESLKVHHHALKIFLADHPISVPIIYILTYIIFVALSIPGAIFLTLLGGYLFPQPWSTIYVVFSATCGAAAIFLAARTAIGDSLRKKAGPFLKKMEKNFQKNATSYLLFLRFVPIFPFWLVNIAPALFGVALSTFIWTTLVGITPGSFVFTLAGGGLEKILESEQNFSLNAIFNTEIKIALSLLGVLSLVPILIKRFKKTKNR